MRKITKGFGVAAGALGLFVAGFMVPTNAHANKALTRLSAQTTAADGNFGVTDGQAILLPTGVSPFGGTPITIYSNTLTVPGSNNVAYITISANALGDCDGVALNCQVDGAPCAGTQSFFPAGWVVPAGDEYGGDSFFGENGLNYQFCAPVTKGSHTFEILGATEFGDCNTYIQSMAVYVDVNRIKDSGNACASYATPNPVASPD